MYSIHFITDRQRSFALVLLAGTHLTRWDLDALASRCYSVDGYAVSLPLNEVLEVDALLAWQMNGVELPNRYGFPLRALVPGRYGEENPKWNPLLNSYDATSRFWMIRCIRCINML